MTSEMVLLSSRAGKRGSQRVQQRTRMLQIACSGMEYHPACVHQVVEPLPVTPHLQHIRMMSTVVLQNHPTVRPGEVHPRDEAPLDPDLELRHRRGEAAPMHHQANLRLSRGFAAPIRETEDLPSPAYSPDTGSSGQPFREVRGTDDASMKEPIDDDESRAGFGQGADIPGRARR